MKKGVDILAGTDFSHLTDDELMNGIKSLNIPDYIRSKSYGIDVRETIAQMTEMLMQLAYNQGMDPQQAKEWASQLNNKLTKGEVTMSDLTQEVKEALTGGSVAVVGVDAVGAENIKDKAVLPIKISDYTNGRNMLSKNAGLTWVVGLLENGVIKSTGTTYKTNLDFISIQPNKDYFLSFDRPDGRGDGGYSFYDVNGNHISTHYISANFKDGLKITPPANARLIRFSIKDTTTWYQFEEGSTPTPYTKEYTLSDLYIGAEKSDIDDAIDKAIGELKNSNIPFNHDAEYVMFTAYGQSWAQGYDNDAYSTEQIYDNLMFNTGVRNNPLESEVTPSSLIPLVERNGFHNWTDPDYAQKVGETPVAGQTNMVKQLLSEENKATTTNVKYQFIGNSPGRGSLSIDGLSKGTVWYNRLVTQVQQAFDLSQAQGKTFKMLAFSWTQGGNEYVADYGAKLEKLRADIEAEVKAITGQSEPVKCITWQPFSGMTNGTAKRLYDEFVKPSETYEHIINAGATYQLDPLSKSNVHLTSQSSAHLGAYYGLAFKRTINDGVKFEPLKPVKLTTQRQMALLEFNNTTPLKFDTESLVQAENYGFKILKADGTQIPITKVEIVSFNTIKIIREAGWFDTTDRIVYGDTGLGYGGTDKKRGNLRDTSDSVYKYKDLSLPLYDWCVVFDLTVSELK